MKALTNEQSQILREMIDANWEADNTSNSYFIRDIERQRYYYLESKLMALMGRDEYYAFMEMGKQMFAPAQS